MHSSIVRVCLIGMNSENGRLGKLGIFIQLTPEVRKRQVWKVAELSAPKGRRFGRHRRDSRFHLRNSASGFL